MDNDTVAISAVFKPATGGLCAVAQLRVQSNVPRVGVGVRAGDTLYSEPSNDGEAGPELPSRLVPLFDGARSCVLRDHARHDTAQELQIQLS